MLHRRFQVLQVLPPLRLRGGEVLDIHIPEKLERMFGPLTSALTVVKNNFQSQILQLRAMNLSLTLLRNNLQTSRKRYLPPRTW